MSISTIINKYLDKIDKALIDIDSFCHEEREYNIEIIKSQVFAIRKVLKEEKQEPLETKFNLNWLDCECGGDNSNEL